jgi:hypothetical protein
MKKALLLVILVLSLPAFAAADPISIGQSIYFADGPGGGNGGAYHVGLGTASPYDFDSFCVEVTESLSFGTRFVIGGIGTSTAATNHALGSEAAWLYHTFRTDLLPNWGDYSDSVRYSTLQRAIWNGTGWLGQGSAGPWDNGLLTAWHTAYASSNWTGTGDVVILNIKQPMVGGALGDAQDVLALQPVPEPVSSLLLLGMGLVALRAWRGQRP